MRPAMLAGAVIAVAAAGVMAGLAASGAFGHGNGSEVKLAKGAVETAVQATGDANWRAPKHAITVVTSCPDENSLHPKTGIWPRDRHHGSPDKEFPYVENSGTTFASDGRAYTIDAGATRDDREQGALRVWLIQADPCAVTAGLVPLYRPRVYQTPFRAGPVTLVEIDSDTVVFQATDGTTGQLNFVTGTFQ